MIVTITWCLRAWKRNRAGPTLIVEERTSRFHRQKGSLMSRPSTAAGFLPVEVVAPARTATTAPAGSLRRLGGWLSALLTDDGVNSRFAAERRRDEGLVRRVESRRRP
jgi:hypothetical protein